MAWTSVPVLNLTASSAQNQVAVPQKSIGKRAIVQIQSGNPGTLATISTGFYWSASAMGSFPTAATFVDIAGQYFGEPTGYAVMVGAVGDAIRIKLTTLGGGGSIPMTAWVAFED